jgi:membrane protease YdiL (CAAX protease family)
MTAVTLPTTQIQTREQPQPQLHPENNIENSISFSSSLFKKVVTGIAIYTLFSTQITLVWIAVEVAFVSLNYFTSLNLNDNEVWFSSKSFTHIEESFSMYKPILKVHLTIGIISKIVTKFFIKIEPQQTVAKLIKYAFTQGFWVASKWVFFATIRAPILEEIILRGFLQDKIKIIQTGIFKFDEKSTLHKTIRIGIQAIVFGALHYHFLQTLPANIAIITSCTIFGFLMGEIKDAQGSICGTIAFHAVHNTCMVARLLFGGF